MKLTIKCDTHKEISIGWKAKFYGMYYSTTRRTNNHPPKEVNEFLYSIFGTRQIDDGIEVSVEELDKLIHIYQNILPEYARRENAKEAFYGYAKFLLEKRRGIK